MSTFSTYPPREDQAARLRTECLKSIRNVSPAHSIPEAEHPNDRLSVAVWRHVWR